MSRRSSFFAALALLAAHSLAAQTDPIIQRIWTIAQDSSHTYRLAQVLFDSVGPRLTGTALQKKPRVS